MYFSLPDGENDLWFVGVPNSRTRKALERNASGHKSVKDGALNKTTAITTTVIMGLLAFILTVVDNASDLPLLTPFIIWVSAALVCIAIVVPVLLRTAQAPNNASSALRVKRHLGLIELRVALRHSSLKSWAEDPACKYIIDRYVTTSEPLVRQIQIAVDERLESPNKSQAQSESERLDRAHLQRQAAETAKWLEDRRLSSLRLAHETFVTELGFSAEGLSPNPPSSSDDDPPGDFKK